MARAVSRRALEWGWEAGTAAKLEPNALAVLQAVAYHAHPYTGRSFPSAETIADELHVHERTVRRAFQTIEKRGILKRETRPGRASLWTFPESARSKPPAKPPKPKRTPDTGVRDPGHSTRQPRTPVSDITSRTGKVTDLADEAIPSRLDVHAYVERIKRGESWE